MSDNKNYPKSPQRPTWLIPVVLVAVIAVIVAIVAVITGNSGNSFEPQVAGSPRAEIDKTTVDHGSVPFGQYVESVFRVRNVGDEPLVILDEPRVELLQGC
ncbi:MAG: hypothetical protein SFZ02_10000 [bacterium]|nr:hypothetical protein [bacterium]